MTFRKGVVQPLSKKQKLNTRSSTEAEPVGADYVTTQILWTKHFMEAQGYTIKENILHQDNKSTILLQENRRKSTGNWSRALNMRYFFLTDQVKKGNLRITYCSTDNMTADYMTKPLQGESFTSSEQKSWDYKRRKTEDSRKVFSINFGHRQDCKLMMT